MMKSLGRSYRHLRVISAMSSLVHQFNSSLIAPVNQYSCCERGSAFTTKGHIVYQSNEPMN